MKRIAISLVLALALCLIGTAAFAAEPILSLSFDGSDNITLNGGAVLEDGVLKLPGGASRVGGYVTLPDGIVQSVTDGFTFSSRVYIPENASCNTYLFSFANGEWWSAMFACVTPEGNVSLNIDDRGTFCSEALVPTGAWTYLTMAVSDKKITLYVAGQPVASYNAKTKDAENCYWRIINDGTANTTYLRDFNEAVAYAGLIGAVTQANTYDQRGDAQAMFDDYRLWAACLTDNEVAALYANTAVPKAAWPIGAAAVEGQQDAKANTVNVPEDGLRLKLDFDDTENVTLVGNADVKDGTLQLTGGEWRQGGHAVLPNDALIMCGNEMTLNMSVCLDENPAGRSFLFAFSNGDAWPGIYAFVDTDGYIHFNVDYRGEMVPSTPIAFGDWVNLTFVASGSELSVYADGELLGAYYYPANTKNAVWNKLNAWNDWTYYAYAEKVALNTGRLGSGYLSLGDQSGVDMAGEIDNFRLYSKAKSAKEVKELYNETAVGGIWIHKYAQGALECQPDQTKDKFTGDASGYQFVITRKDGKKIKLKDGTEVASLSGTTDKNGLLTFEDLPQAAYTIHEQLTTAQKEHFISPKDQQYTVVEYNRDANGRYIKTLEKDTVTASFYNLLATGEAKIYKTIDKENGSSTPLAGVVFEIKRVDGDETLWTTSRTVPTDENGKIYISSLPAGDYLLNEVSGDANKGYPLVQDLLFHIDANKLTNVYAGSVKTGDTSVPELWLALCVAGLMGIGGVLLFVRKKKQQ